MTERRKNPGFDPGGWESAGWPIYARKRYRLWVPPGSRLDARWGILIREDVSARGQMAILEAIPVFDLGDRAQIVLRRRV